MAEYFYIIDYVEAFFWTITYILIALVGFVNKDDRRLAMPKISLFANFAWEVASVLVIRGSYLDQGGIIRLAWLIFDVAIVLSVYFKNKKSTDFNKKTICWGLSWFALTVIFYIGFNSHELFMPFSAFAIDIEMALLFFVQRKKLDPCLRVYIAATKLIGDILAGFYCSVAVHYGIAFIAVGSFIFNVLYLVYAVKEIKQNPDINDSFKNNINLLYKRPKSLRAKQIEHHNARKYKKKKVKKTHRKK